MKFTDKIKLFLGGLPGKVKIKNKYVGAGEPVFVIAEIGINHNGDMETAKKMIVEAKLSGADAVKFQKRTTTEILTKEGLEKPYNSPHAYAPTYGEHRDKLEFNEDQYREIKKFCEEQEILFFASVWDKTSADFMASLDTDAYKIPSADTINIPLLEYVADKGKPVLLSTGMNTEDEISVAVQTVLKRNPKVIIFHCLSLYPSPEEKINLSYMDRLNELFHPLPVGYSGHEIDIFPTLMAVSRGATIVERHFTLDKAMKGGDHAASLTPVEFKEMVDGIRRVERILGKKEKKIIEELVPLREKLAKSVATKVAIKAGTKITKEMLAIKGPGTGIPPKDLESLVGKIAKTDLDEDVIVPKDALSW